MNKCIKLNFNLHIVEINVYTFSEKYFLYKDGRVKDGNVILPKSLYSQKTKTTHYILDGHEIEFILESRNLRIVLRSVRTVRTCVVTCNVYGVYDE